MPKGLDEAMTLVEPMGLEEVVEPLGLDEEIRSMHSSDTEFETCDTEFDIKDRVFISYNPAQRHFGEKLCEEIKNRGLRRVGDVLEECGIIVVILYEEYLLSKLCMLELAAITNSVMKGNNHLRVLPAYLGVSPAECRAPPSQWLEVWHNWAKSADSPIHVEECRRALHLLNAINGLVLQEYSELKTLNIIVDTLFHMQHSRRVEASKSQRWSSDEAVDWKTCESIQEDALLNGPSLVPDCWILRKPEFTNEEFLARGTSKSVMKCQWKGMFVAVAQFTSSKTKLEAEAGVLARVQHPNVVEMFGCYYDDCRGIGYLVTELMEQDLSKLIEKAAGRDIPGASTRDAPKQKLPWQGDGVMPFTISVTTHIILQIVEAMIHIYKCGVVHRDLKPANCVVKKRTGDIDEGETHYVVKVIDFGSAKVQHPGASTCHTRKKGTTPFMAPELHAEEGKCAYKKPADVYSFGMTMYVIFTGKLSPFEGERLEGGLVTSVCEGKRPSFPECIPDFWKQLVEICWHRESDRRPSFESIRDSIHLGYIT